ncbi:adenylate kinase [Pseudomonas sp. MYb187]|nr:adenylate kinase [Pseudomonas sp. MYb187]
MRIYMTGASCAGVTTLGENLASPFGMRHADIEDFFWLPTNPAFSTKRPVSERVPLIRQTLGDDDWLLTGSCMPWASQSDEPSLSGRNQAWHERWLSAQTSAVLEIDGANSAEKMAAEVSHSLARMNKDA